MAAPKKSEPVERRPLRRFVSYRILRTHFALNAQATALLAENAGITLSQWRIMSFLGAREAQTSRDIVALSGLDPAIVSRAVKSLEEDALITVARLAEDRRTLALGLTAEGQAVFERTLPIMQARQEALLDALDPAEREAIISSLEKIELAAERRDF